MWNKNWSSYSKIEDDFYMILKKGQISLFKIKTDNYVLYSFWNFQFSNFHLKNYFPINIFGEIKEIKGLFKNELLSMCVCIQIRLPSFINVWTHYSYTNIVINKLLLLFNYEEIFSTLYFYIIFYIFYIKRIIIYSFSILV